MTLDDLNREGHEAEAEGCTCEKCLRKYKVDLLVPDQLWDVINPVNQDGFRAYELLCPTCIMGIIEGQLSFAAFSLHDAIGRFDEATTGEHHD